ncbi:uncharacterized protein L203_106443 [Cryptococcus depauperatus CBS 7841]|uniref:Uncharacterized protein n=1 Tax=Cryptococcus depauperatus CBS 7841 TaxID=1295531 RepID=A0AAJ8M540_9TREE
MRIVLPSSSRPSTVLYTAAIPSLYSPFYLLRRTRLKFLLFAIAFITLFVWQPSPPFPPSYSKEWEMEKASADAKTKRMVQFEIPKGTEFSHQLQRILLQHHLAVLGNRSLSYEPCVEDFTILPFKPFEWPWRSARIPLSAFVSTVVSGFEAYYNSQCAVPSWYYRNHCPTYRETTYTLRSKAHLTGDIDLQDNSQNGIHQLQMLLASNGDSCIRIQGDPFDNDFFNSRAPLELYDSFIKSPVMEHFAFSPRVLTILNNHMDMLAPGSLLYDIEGVREAKSNSESMVGVWKHVLALHIRRGKDWERVCSEKGETSAPFVSFNKLSLLPGNENIPPSPKMVQATRLGLYRAKCLPQTLDIISRARRLRKNHPLLKSIYILTDDVDDQTKELKMWLQSEGWENVWLGKEDVWPGWKEKEVGVAVDMEVARRAGVFVGNGFSMTSSNIVLLRSRDGLHPDLTQFW